jgi:hypothetical protein
VGFPKAESRASVLAFLVDLLFPLFRDISLREKAERFPRRSAFVVPCGNSREGGIVPLPAAVQRRVDDAANAWAHAFPDPDVADPALRSAAHRFADATAPVLLGVAPARALSSRLPATTALLLAGLTLLGPVLPVAAVPLLVAGALVCLGIACAAAAAAPAAPPLEELRAALRSAAYRGVLSRRSSATGSLPQPLAGPRDVPGVVPAALGLLPAERGRATYEAATHLVDRDTATVIDL